MKSDIDKFIGTWGNDAGNLLVITKSTDLIALVSFFTGPNTSPAIRSYYENKPSIDMYSYLADCGATIKVDLWGKGRGFSLHLTYEHAYELDKGCRDSLVPSLSRYEGDSYLDQYYRLFEPLKHYTKGGAEQVGACSPRARPL